MGFRGRCPVSSVRVGVGVRVGAGLGVRGGVRARLQSLSMCFGLRLHSPAAAHAVQLLVLSAGLRVRSTSPG